MGRWLSKGTLMASIGLLWHMTPKLLRKRIPFEREISQSVAWCGVIESLNVKERFDKIITYDTNTIIRVNIITWSLPTDRAIKMRLLKVLYSPSQIQDPYIWPLCQDNWASFPSLKWLLYFFELPHSRIGEQFC